MMAFRVFEMAIMDLYGSVESCSGLMNETWIEDVALADLGMTWE